MVTVRCIMKKITVTIIALILLIVIALPWALYGIGLSFINGRPVPPTNVTLNNNKVKLTPYHVIYSLITNNGVYLENNSKMAWGIARSYNNKNLEKKRMSYWHLSGAALTIWVTRNWNSDQIKQKYNEIKASNN